MSRSSISVVEEFAVGLYVLVLCGSVAGFGWVQVTTGPVIGGAFIAIGLFWLAVLAAVWASLVVLSINAYRYFRDGTPVWTAIAFAVSTPLSIGGEIYLAFVTTHDRLWILLGALGFLCSLGLVTTIFEGRARRVWSHHVH